jgi:predicted membrane channel-forming protein YqfA (hemolysin III family)
MKSLLPRATFPLVVAIVLALFAYGPIHQPEHYHAFASQGAWLGIANGQNVLSNAGFAGVGMWGLIALWPHRRDPRLMQGWSGYQLFLISLILTSLGSSFYHLAPDNARLVWDRLPIALASAGLLAAVHADTSVEGESTGWTFSLGLCAIGSVAWWWSSGLHGEGDLRPYLVMQVSPLVFIPLWQHNFGTERIERILFGCAILVYALAKLAEVEDQAILASTGWISGHTLKHLLASGAAALVVMALIDRVSGQDREKPMRFAQGMRAKGAGQTGPTMR